MKEFAYQKLLELNKDYIDTLNTLHKLNTFDTDKVNKLFMVIKKHLIETKYFTPSRILKLISVAGEFNNKYTKSYWTIFKNIYEEYHPKSVCGITSIYNYLAYKEYGIVLDKTKKEEFSKFKSNKHILDVHEENTVFKAIMDNNIALLSSFAENEGFNKDQRMENVFYPWCRNGYSLLEVSCYHGSVDCFKYLRSKFNSEITEHCLYFSFLHGIQDIVCACLNEQEISSLSKHNAISMRNNIDFEFLVENGKLIDAMTSYKFNNLEAFLKSLKTYKDLNKCFVYSPMFGLLSVCQYFISLDADISSVDYRGRTALHYAAKNGNIEIAEFLLSCGADVNAKSERNSTALHYAAKQGNTEIVELLISYGADINQQEKNGSTPLDYALKYGEDIVADILISHGARISVCAI